MRAHPLGTVTLSWTSFLTGCSYRVLEKEDRAFLLQGGEADSRAGTRLGSVLLTAASVQLEQIEPWQSCDGG